MTIESARFDQVRGKLDRRKRHMLFAADFHFTAIMAASPEQLGIRFPDAAIFCHLTNKDAMRNGSLDRERSVGF